jgi:hypothetical protein
MRGIFFAGGLLRAAQLSAAGSSALRRSQVLCGSQARNGRARQGIEEAIPSPITSRDFGVSPRQGPHSGQRKAIQRECGPIDVGAEANFRLPSSYF